MTALSIGLKRSRLLGGMPRPPWSAVGLLLVCAWTQSAGAEEPRHADGQRSAAETTVDMEHGPGYPRQQAVSDASGRKQTMLKHPSTGGGMKDARRTLRRRAARVEAEPGRATAGRERLATPWYRSGLGALGIVLALMGVVCFCVRKWIPAVRVAESQAMRVVARASVSPKQSVALIQLGRRFVMVGVSPERMSVLSVISDQEEVADLAQVSGTSSDSSRPGFAHCLEEESEDFGADREGPSAMVTTADQDPIRVVGSDSGKALGDLLHRLRKLHTSSEKNPATGSRRSATRRSL